MWTVLLARAKGYKHDWWLAIGVIELGPGRVAQLWCVGRRLA